MVEKLNGVQPLVHPALFIFSGLEFSVEPSGQQPIEDLSVSGAGFETHLAQRFPRSEGFNVPVVEKIMVEMVYRKGRFT